MASALAGHSHLDRTVIRSFVPFLPLYRIESMQLGDRISTG
jgi:hypothetical protein